MEQSLCHHGVESQQPSLPVSNYTQPIRTKRKPAQTHSSNNRKKEKKEKWNHLNVKWPMLAHATTLTSSSSFFSQSLFLFSFSPQIQEACGVEAACGVGCRMWRRWFWREFILSCLTLKALRVSFHTFTVFIWCVEQEILRSAPLKSPFRSGVSCESTPESGEDVWFAVLLTDTSNLIRYDDDGIYTLRIYVCALKSLQMSWSVRVATRKITKISSYFPSCLRKVSVPSLHRENASFCFLNIHVLI